MTTQASTTPERQTGYTRPESDRQPPAGVMREAYMADGRVRAARIIALIAAAAAMVTVTGYVLGWVYYFDHDPAAGHSALQSGPIMGWFEGHTGLKASVFDVLRWQTIERSTVVTHVYRAGWGFLFVPPLIMLTLPIVRRRGIAREGAFRIAYRQGYVPRVVIAAILWGLGLGLWVFKLVQLSGGLRTTSTGAYVGTVILSVGLIATLAMLPLGLRRVRVDMAGNLQAA